jgi:hypothetical protein
MRKLSEYRPSEKAYINIIKFGVISSQEDQTRLLLTIPINSIIDAVTCRK